LSVEILEAFGLPGPRAVHLIGAGGKTTLLFALAHALAANGQTVVTTTTTMIREPQPGQTGALVLGDESPGLAAALARHRHVTVAAGRLIAERKLRGLSPAALEALLGACVADVLLVEADGSAGLPLKAHMAHEPVFAPSADAVIAVIGADAVGQPLDDAHVHRAGVARARLGLSEGHVVTPGDVAALVLHAEGWLARVPGGASVSVFVSKVRDTEARLTSQAIADALRAGDTDRRIVRIVAGDVVSGTFETIG
jgi:probable selenium-dependent hydroxylase accessory protein YqeC